jgi:hypothetical protein
LARWLLGLGIAATLMANMAQGWSHGLVGAVVAAWPAVSLVRHPEPSRHLLAGGAGPDHRCRGEPHLLAAGPFRGGQPAAVGVPHDRGRAHNAPRYRRR